MFTWFAVVAPAGTPRAIVDRLNAEIVKAARSAEVRDTLAPQGYDIEPGSPERLTESIREGLARMPEGTFGRAYLAFVEREHQAPGRVKCMPFALALRPPMSRGARIN